MKKRITFRQLIVVGANRRGAPLTKYSLLHKTQILTLLFLSSALTAAAKDYKLTSPDGRLSAAIATGSTTTFTLRSAKQPILQPSTLALLTADGTPWGANTGNAKAKRQSVDRSIESPLYKRATVSDRYNALTLTCRGYKMEFRMYDDGMAYRFVDTDNDSLTIVSETANYRFCQDFQATVPYIINRTKKPGAPLEQQWWNDQQCQFTPTNISKTNPQNLMAMPFTVTLDHGEKLCMLEADQMDYPGIYLLKDASEPLTLKAVFPKYPKTLERGGHGNIEMKVTEREDYMARTSGNRTFPWRVFIVAHDDGELVNNDMVYRLATPCQIGDTSWIKPGKAAWDWWNNRALFGVDFKAGFNNDTYRYFIDFAKAYGLEYVLIDEGWFSTKTTDIFDLVPDIDIKALVDYAESRGVGILLWAGYLSLARDLEKAVSHYASLGVKGFKIDFLNRDDQPMMQFMLRTAELCARHHLLVDFHGTGKPSGLQRTYPNVVNYEAVFGLEQMRWSPATLDMVTHDVTLPFTRMVAGPMDYTPGAMRNSLKGMYYPCKRTPMSQGTRMHQVGMYFCYDAPLTMLSDSPSKYESDAVCTRFIAGIPTVWDDTRVLAASLGEYLVVARRKGNRWYIGAINNWQERTLEVTLPEECRGRQAEVMCDGRNADKVAEDYQHSVVTIADDGHYSLHMASGGGWGMITAP